VEEALAEGDDGGGGAGLEVCGLADPEDVVVDVFEALGVEADDPGLRIQGGGEGADGIQVDGADLAEVLSEDEVGFEAGKECGVEGVEGGEGGELGSDGCIDLGGCGGGRGLLRGQNRDGIQAAWEVTFVRAADQEGSSADEAQDLGGGGEEADDAHTVGVSGLVRGGTVVGWNGGTPSAPGTGVNQMVAGFFQTTPAGTRYNGISWRTRP
jgi:hypothetical protein